MIVAYIAHPIAGDVAGNVARVKAIMADIIRTESDAAPIAPYLTYLEILDDNKPEERARGMSMNLEQLAMVDELRLYGDRISKGMWKEIKHFASTVLAGLDPTPYILPMTKGTRRDFTEWRSQATVEARRYRKDDGPTPERATDDHIPF